MAVKVARWQNLIPNFPLIVPPHPQPWSNPRKGRDQILPSGNLVSKSVATDGRDVPPPRRLRRDLGVRRLPRRRILLRAEPVRQRHEARAGTLHQGTEGEGCRPQTGVLTGTKQSRNYPLAVLKLALDRIRESTYQNQLKAQTTLRTQYAQYQA